MRSNEISAVIGLSQLKRLNKNNLKRKKNFKFFLNNLDRKIFYTNFDLKGNSSIKDLRNKIENSNPLSVLDGNIDQFIEEGIKLRK